MITVAFATLGCKVNQVETEQIKEDFLKDNYLEVSFKEMADIYVINTCSVTHVSDRKSRGVIRRAIRMNPKAIIVVTGCLAQADVQAVAKIEGVNLIIGNGVKQDTEKITAEYIKNINQGLKIVYPEIIPEMKPRRILYSFHHARTRAFLKIQDGCESFCSYCIVPYARGPMRSKLPDDVLKEIRQLLKLGYREIVLNGIHVGYYGSDLPGWDLLRLIKTILDEIPGEYRLRLGSIESVGFPMELAEIAAKDNRICCHFHIPLQSGSSKVLKEMNRRYSRDEFRKIVKEIVSIAPNTCFTTDIMVGFPGETDLDYQDSEDLIAELPFGDLHVFPYSRRSGTPAAKRLDQVDDMTKQLRSHALLRLAKNKKRDFINSMQGKTLRMLIEREIAPNIWAGLTDEYIEVCLRLNENKQGEFVNVCLKGIEENGLAVVEIV